MSLASQGRRLPLPPLVHLAGQGGGTLGSGGFEDRISHPLLIASSSLSRVPLPILSYSPGSIKGKALHMEVLSLIEKGAVELASPSPGY